MELYKINFIISGEERVQFVAHDNEENAIEFLEEFWEEDGEIEVTEITKRSRKNGKSN